MTEKINNPASAYKKANWLRWLRMSEKKKSDSDTGLCYKRFTYAISGFSHHKWLRDAYLRVTGDSWFFECAGRAAVGEHELNHKRMNDSPGSLAEVGTLHARQCNAPFTTRHYLNWKEYLYQLRDQKLMEAVMHQLSYIKMSVGKGWDNYILLKDF